MHQGVIFDIKEFSVHDGPGVRQTVFLKGCPLRCNWCHNPEGWEMQPQLLIRKNDCIQCGACRDFCRQAACLACGSCVTRCPVRARWVCGEILTSEDLARRILKNAKDYTAMGGGVTFSGGEPLLQPEFLMETTALLPGIHKVLETCGHAQPQVFRHALESFDLIYMDFKLADPELHQRFTGQSNHWILENIDFLCKGNLPFVIRIPMIPGVTDTGENLDAIAARLAGAKALQYVEFLPYNRMAGTKYSWLGQSYRPHFIEDWPVDMRHDLFDRHGIESRGR